MKVRKRTAALFAAPFCVQAAGLLAFMHRGSKPVEACVWSMLALLPILWFAGAYASFGCRIGVLRREWREPLHGLCFASMAVGPIGMLAVFAASVGVSGSGVFPLLLGAFMAAPYLAAVVAILCHVAAGLMDVKGSTVAAALVLQAAAYAALVMLA